MDALKLDNVTKRYEGFTLDNISLSLPQGCIMGFIGENGSGKTTTIKLIMDLIQRDGGSITVLGEDNRKGLGAVKENVGVVLQPQASSQDNAHHICLLRCAGHCRQ